LADLRVFLLRWPRGGQDRGLVTVRMLYLILIRMVAWMALLARSAASNDAELQVLRQEVQPKKSAGSRAVVHSKADVSPAPRRTISGSC
jgi:hypothetical protein